MTTFVFPDGDYRTLSGALTDTSKTEIYTTGDLGKEDAALILGLRVVDSTGSVATGLTVHCQLSSADTERVLDLRSTAIDEYGYEIEGLPIRLGPGGTIDLTGGNGHHWWLAILPAGVGSTTFAQIKG